MGKLRMFIGHSIESWGEKKNDLPRRLCAEQLVVGEVHVCGSRDSRTRRPWVHCCCWTSKASVILIGIDGRDGGENTERKTES